MWGVWTMQSKQKLHQNIISDTTHCSKKRSKAFNIFPIKKYAEDKEYIIVPTQPRHLKHVGSYRIKAQLAQVNQSLKCTNNTNRKVRMCQMSGPPD